MYDVICVCFFSANVRISAFLENSQKLMSEPSKVTHVCMEMKGQ